MKKILFDLSVCQPIGSSKFHGGGVYGYIVFKALANHSSNSIIAYWDSSKYIPDDITEIIQNKGIESYDSSQTTIGDLYDKHKFDRLYSPLWSNSYFSLFEKNVPIMLTQHGLRALEMNRGSYETKYANGFKEYVKCLLKHSPVYDIIWHKYYKSFEKIFRYPNLEIVTVSEHSKASILYYYPFVPENKINVCYSPNTSEPIEISGAPQEKFYLIVSANRWLKNAYQAIMAFDKLFDSYPDFNGKVYVTGIKPDSKLLSKLQHRNRFVTYDYLERNELEKLYHDAYALVYPSLNEGFGYPPIEAMRYGTPVISSSFASISEICGSAPLYVNPYSVDEIGIRILELEDKSLYRMKKEQSLLRYQTIEKKQKKDLETLIYLITKD